MPFDVAKSCGTWKYGGGSDNGKDIMVKMGIPPEMVDKFLEAPYPTEMSLKGTTLDIMTEFEGTCVESSYTLDVEGEEEDPMGGTKRKVTYSMKGECLECSYPDHDGKGLKVWTSREFVDDNTIKTTIKAGDLEGWSLCKRC